MVLLVTYLGALSAMLVYTLHNLTIWSKLAFNVELNSNFLYQKLLVIIQPWQLQRFFSSRTKTLLWSEMNCNVSKYFFKKYKRQSCKTYKVNCLEHDSSTALIVIFPLILKLGFYVKKEVINAFVIFFKELKF